MWTNLDKFMSKSMGKEDGAALAAVSGGGPWLGGEAGRRCVGLRLANTAASRSQPTRPQLGPRGRVQHRLVRLSSFIVVADNSFLAGPDASYVSGASLTVTVSSCGGRPLTRRAACTCIERRECTKEEASVGACTNEKQRIGRYGRSWPR